MQDFKIIGIKVDDTCSVRLSKVLEPKKIYHFYNDFKINEVTDEINFSGIAGFNLYGTQNVNVNISAIAGKNGSGKSTIIELLFMIINNLSLNNSEFKNSLKPIKGLKASLYFKTDCFYKIEINDNKSLVYKYKGDEISKIPESNFNFKDLFYTVAINYSQYALNSKDMGNWLDGLFHKNDGYQIPIVINPMRIDGNIDINTENGLVNSRLITNLVRPIEHGNIDFRNIGDNLIATKLSLLSDYRNISQKTLYKKVNVIKENEKGFSSEETIEIKIIDLKIDKIKILNKLSEVYDFKYSDLQMFDYEDIVNPILKHSLDYLVYKLVNIAVTYPSYFEYFDKKNNTFYETEFETYLNELLFKDKSHIGFKIKQTLNFLKYQHYSLSTQSLTLNSVTRKIDNLINNPNNNLTEENRIELLPPPIFKSEIILESRTLKKGEKVKFNSLSSGEKQMIYSVSSILYHLTNLDSVDKGFKYENVNIILDEIELYFHPDFQRKYVKYILDSISCISFKNIKNINMSFVTHSPFILSDIPNSNIMFLELNPEKSIYSQQVLVSDKTFSANIHDLLSKSFFLNKGFMGEFAISKIKEIISDLKQMKKEKVTSQILDSQKTKILEIKNVINIVGEPILKQKLIELFEDSVVYETIEDKVNRLKSELDEALKEQEKTE